MRVVEVHIGHKLVVSDVVGEDGCAANLLTHTGLQIQVPGGYAGGAHQHLLVFVELGDYAALALVLGYIGDTQHVTQLRAISRNHAAALEFQVECAGQRRAVIVANVVGDDKVANRLGHFVSHNGALEILGQHG